MRLLDLYCGAGGAALGYLAAGWDVVGVDHETQPHYPGPFVQWDALDFLARTLDGQAGVAFDAIHASPPCQAHSAARHGWHGQGVSLIEETRRLLERFHGPTVIENVVGAPLQGNVVQLCGSSFGLRVLRHRRFELRHFAVLAPSCQHAGTVRDGSYETVWCKGAGSQDPTRGRQHVLRPQAVAALGLPADAGAWSWQEIGNVVPPAYTEYLGLAMRRRIDVH